jgi:hypothetical protein
VRLAPFRSLISQLVTFLHSNPTPAPDCSTQSHELMQRRAAIEQAWHIRDCVLTPTCPDSVYVVFFVLSVCHSNFRFSSRESRKLTGQKSDLKSQVTPRFRTLDRKRLDSIQYRLAEDLSISTRSFLQRVPLFCSSLLPALSPCVGRRIWHSKKKESKTASSSGTVPRRSTLHKQHHTAPQAKQALRIVSTEILNEGRRWSPIFSSSAAVDRICRVSNLFVSAFSDFQHNHGFRENTVAEGRLGEPGIPCWLGNKTT